MQLQNDQKNDNFGTILNNYITNFPQNATVQQQQSSIEQFLLKSLHQNIINMNTINQCLLTCKSTFKYLILLYTSIITQDNISTLCKFYYQLINSALKVKPNNHQNYYNYMKNQIYQYSFYLFMGDFRFINGMPRIISYIQNRKSNNIINHTLSINKICKIFNSLLCITEVTSHSILELLLGLSKVKVKTQNSDLVLALVLERCEEKLCRRLKINSNQLNSQNNIYLLIHVMLANNKQKITIFEKAISTINNNNLNQQIITIRNLISIMGNKYYLYGKYIFHLLIQLLFKNKNISIRQSILIILLQYFKKNYNCGETLLSLIIQFYFQENCQTINHIIIHYIGQQVFKVPTTNKIKLILKNLLNLTKNYKTNNTETFRIQKIVNLISILRQFSLYYHTTQPVIELLDTQSYLQIQNLKDAKSMYFCAHIYLEDGLPHIQHIHLLTITLSNKQQYSLFLTIYCDLTNDSSIMFYKKSFQVKISSLNDQIISQKQRISKFIYKNSIKCFIAVSLLEKQEYYKDYGIGFCIDSKVYEMQHKDKSQITSITFGKFEGTLDNITIFRDQFDIRTINMQFLQCGSKCHNLLNKITNKIPLISISNCEQTLLDQDIKKSFFRKKIAKITAYGINKVKNYSFQHIIQQLGDYESLIFLIVKLNKALVRHFKKTDQTTLVIGQLFMIIQQMNLNTDNDRYIVFINSSFQFWSEFIFIIMKQNQQLNCNCNLDLLKKIFRSLMFTRQKFQNIAIIKHKKIQIQFIMKILCNFQIWIICGTEIIQYISKLLMDYSSNTNLLHQLIVRDWHSKIWTGLVVFFTCSDDNYNPILMTKGVINASLKYYDIFCTEYVYSPARLDSDQAVLINQYIYRDITNCLILMLLITDKKNGLYSNSQKLVLITINQYLLKNFVVRDQIYHILQNHWQSTLYILCNMLKSILQNTNLHQNDEIILSIMNLVIQIYEVCNKYQQWLLFSIDTICHHSKGTYIFFLKLTLKIIERLCSQKQTIIPHIIDQVCEATLAHLLEIIIQYKNIDTIIKSIDFTKMYALLRNTEKISIKYISCNRNTIHLFQHICLILGQTDNTVRNIWIEIQKYIFNVLYSNNLINNFNTPLILHILNSLYRNITTFNLRKLEHQKILSVQVNVNSNYYLVHHYHGHAVLCFLIDNEFLNSFPEQQYPIHNYKIQQSIVKKDQSMVGGLLGYYLLCTQLNICELKFLLAMLQSNPIKQTNIQYVLLIWVHTLKKIISKNEVDIQGCFFMIKLQKYVDFSMVRNYAYFEKQITQIWQKIDKFFIQGQNFKNISQQLTLLCQQFILLQEKIKNNTNQYLNIQFQVFIDQLHNVFTKQNSQGQIKNIQQQYQQTSQKFCQTTETCSEETMKLIIKFFDNIINNSEKFRNTSKILQKVQMLSSISLKISRAVYNSHFAVKQNIARRKSSIQLSRPKINNIDQNYLINLRIKLKKVLKRISKQTRETQKNWQQLIQRNQFWLSIDEKDQRDQVYQIDEKYVGSTGYYRMNICTKDPNQEFVIPRRRSFIAKLQTLQQTSESVELDGDEKSQISEESIVLVSRVNNLSLIDNIISDKSILQENKDGSTKGKNNMKYKLKQTHDKIRKNHSTTFFCQCITMRGIYAGTLQRKNNILEFKFIGHSKLPQDSLVYSLSTTKFHRILSLTTRQHKKYEQFTIILSNCQLLTRRYILRHTAFELFDVLQHRSYFFNLFYNQFRNQLIKDLKLELMTCIFDRNEQFKKKKYTIRWKSGEISNFEYLSLINKFSGRTFNDLAQYPVMPWVIANYKGQGITILDEKFVKDPQNLRNLQLPPGKLGKQKFLKLRKRFDDMRNTNKDEKLFLYGTMYSNPTVIYNFFIRLQPFTNLHYQHQGKKIDHPDRLFSSIHEQYDSVLTASSDMKQLSPEFYYWPQFLKNWNLIDFGRRQNSEEVKDIKLPVWAENPEQFIFKMRQVLESNRVSSMLHHWIDLVFGFKASKQVAQSYDNLYHYHCYEEDIFKKYNDEIDIITAQVYISEFGQVAEQVFKQKHPEKHQRGPINLDQVKLITSQSNNVSPIKRFQVDYDGIFRWNQQSIQFIETYINSMHLQTKDIKKITHNLGTNIKLYSFENYCWMVLNDGYLSLYHRKNLKFKYQINSNYIQVIEKIIIYALHSKIIIIKINQDYSIEKLGKLYGHKDTIVFINANINLDIILSIDIRGHIILHQLCKMKYIRNFQLRSSERCTSTEQHNSYMKSIKVCIHEMGYFIILDANQTLSIYTQKYMQDSFMGKLYFEQDIEIPNLQKNINAKAEFITQIRIQSHQHSYLLLSTSKGNIYQLDFLKVKRFNNIYPYKNFSRIHCNLLAKCKEKILKQNGNKIISHDLLNHSINDFILLKNQGQYFPMYSIIIQYISGQMVSFYQKLYLGQQLRQHKPLGQIGII